MKLNKILFKILIFALLSGGIMGIIKGLLPNMTWLSFRFLSGMGSTFGNDKTPAYAVLYGLVLAILEIISSVLLLSQRKIGFNFTITTLSISALGCLVAIFLGDFFSICSLLVRILGLYIVIKVKAFTLTKAPGHSFHEGIEVK